MNATLPWPLSYRVIGAGGTLATEFSTLFQNCGLLARPDGNAQVTVMLNCRTGMPVPASQARPVVEWRDMSVTQHADEVWFSYRSWQLQLSLANLTLRCWGPDPDALDRLNFREFFLLSPLLFLMHRLGYFELHAAGCAYGDTGYLLLGPSGSGKTSAILALIESGWTYVSDDAMVLCTAPHGRSSMRALRRSFSVRADFVERHPELEPGLTEHVPGTDKRRLDPRLMWPDKYIPVAHPGFIVACTIADDETTRVVRLSQGETLARLVGSTPWLMFDRATAPVHLEAFRSLAAKCPGFELQAGRDLFHDRERLASLLDPEKLKWA